MYVTPFYAGLLALWYFALSMRVVQMRTHGSASLGDGGDASLLRRIRGHANFAEYVPYILLMMALLELARFSHYFLHAVGITLVVARLLHGYSLSYSTEFKFGRFYGTLLTFILVLVCGLGCIYVGIRGMSLL